MFASALSLGKCIIYYIFFTVPAPMGCIRPQATPTFSSFLKRSTRSWRAMGLKSTSPSKASRNVFSLCLKIISICEVSCQSWWLSRGMIVSHCLSYPWPGFNSQPWRCISGDLSQDDQTHLERRWTSPTHHKPIESIWGIQSSTARSWFRYFLPARGCPLQHFYVSHTWHNKGYFYTYS